ncbi:MAG: hypothetical protein WAV93_09420 [Bacteroidales bacterium]
MKNLMLLFTVILLASLISCEEKIDIEKEKEAIKAVFEQEKEGFFNQDAKVMAETWIQEPSSVKMYMLDDGQTKFTGWDAIKKHDEENVADTSLDRKKFTVTFRDYEIQLLEDEAAWVTCETVWNGVENDLPVELIQTRINVLRKDQGKWKFALMAIYNHPRVN